jgi:hypothetical protein
MYPSTRLKLCSVFFTVFWIVGMLWWSDSIDGANIIMLAICGVVSATSGIAPCAGSCRAEGFRRDRQIEPCRDHHTIAQLGLAAGC